MVKLKERQLFCVKCKQPKTVPADDLCVKIFKNKRMVGGKVPALRSECPKCGTNLTKFIKHASTASMVKKYGKC